MAISFFLFLSALHTLFCIQYVLCTNCKQCIFKTWKESKFVLPGVLHIVLHKFYLF
jgi:hypothetical protein